jgi:hypothetical protein
MASNCVNSKEGSTQTSQIFCASREEIDLEPKLSLDFAVFPAMCCLEASITLVRFNMKNSSTSSARHPSYELTRHVMVFSNIDVNLVGLRPGLVF